MKKKNILLLKVLLALLTLPFSISAQVKLSSDTTEVLIIHTNDMHAKIDNFGKLAYLADSLRKTHTYVMLVASGDNFTGNPYVDMIPDKGFPMIDLMNRVGFQVSALGNHEFDLGQTFLNKRIAQAKFPFICCNLNTEGAELQPLKPWITLKAGNEEIPFIGIIELGINGLPDSHPDRMKGIRFFNGLEKALEYKWLKSKYGILIGLTHLGVDDDKKLAGNMPEFDLILGGHSHTLIDKPLMVNGVLITQAGSGLKYAGITTIKIYQHHIINRDDKIINLSDIKKSEPGIQAKIDEYNKNPELDQVVGHADEDLTGSSELGSLMCDAIVKELSLDVAFQNRGGIRLSSISKGDIKLKDIYRLDPFGNLIVQYSLTRDEIKSLICNAYNREKSLDLEVSGLQYTIITDSLYTCKDVILTWPDGTKPDPEKKFKVGVNSYIASSYIFNHQDPGSTLNITTAQALINYMKSLKSLNYKGIVRISRKVE